MICASVKRLLLILSAPSSLEQTLHHGEGHSGGQVSERKQIVCGLHVPLNLCAIPQGMNREIKRDRFDSVWPVDGERAMASRFDGDDFPF